MLLFKQLFSFFEACYSIVNSCNVHVNSKISSVINLIDSGQQLFSHTYYKTNRVTITSDSKLDRLFTRAVLLLTTLNQIRYFGLYKKRLVSRINPSLLLKIILYNTLTLQLTKFN